MGFRFSLEHANWLAHILQPSGATPQLSHPEDQDLTLRKFINTFLDNFYSSPSGRRALRDYFYAVRPDGRPYLEVQRLFSLRDYFQQIPWVSLLLPSGSDRPSDRLLTDAGFLSELVNIRPEDPGLILQLESIPAAEIALQSVFPAFKVALAEITRWPGILIWTPNGDAVFLELSRTVGVIQERLRWVFSHLATMLGSPNLALLKQQFLSEMVRDGDAGGRVRILHLSDIHLGSSVARRRLPRVQTIIESVVAELGENDPIVPVITGDLMESPNEENLGDVRSFIGFLNGLGVEEPILILGNHDVREDGWRSPQLEQAVNISRSPVVWFDNAQTGFACFNSVNAGHLARGYIGEAEYANVGNAIDQQREKAASFTMLALVHHHPIPVEIPSWYRRKWYERFLGSYFEKTESLEDADIFLNWLGSRQIPAVLHGHKHIPRFDMHGDLAVIGCGSTVGKVDTAVPGETFMSLNVVTVDRARGLIGCRLRAERIPGAGLGADESHELVMKTDLRA